MIKFKIFQNKIIKNFSSLAFNQGVQSLIQIILIPFYLNYWSLNTYSEWILISTIPIIFSFSNFGLATYGINSITILFNKNKIKNVNYVIQNTIFFSSLFLIFFYIIIIICNDLLSLSNVLKVTSLNDNEFFIVISIISLKLLFIQLFNFFSDLYRIENKFHITINLRTSFIITESIFIFLALFYGGKILTISFIGLLNYFLALIIITIVIKKKFSWIKFINTKNLNFSYIKKIFYPSTSFLISSINRGLIAQGTIIVLNYFSLDLFTILYNSLRLIINGIRHLINSFSTSYIPSVTINFAKKKYHYLLNDLKFLIKYNFFVSLIAFLMILLFIKTPFIIWTDYKIEWNQLFFVLFMCANLIEWISLPIFLIPLAVNKIHLFNIIFINSILIYFITLLNLIKFDYYISIPVAMFFTNIYLLIHGSLILYKKIINDLKY